MPRDTEPGDKPACKSSGADGPGDTRRLTTGRLEAFSDGVFAILITIMVLNLRLPAQPTWTALTNRGVVGSLLLYLLSFVFLGIYWANHHHMMALADTVTGGILWANLLLLFSLSLIPFVTRWAGERPPSSAPVAAYAVVSLLCAVTYTILQWRIIRAQGERSALAEAIGSDFKGRVSVLAYVTALVFALFVTPWISIAILVAVAAMWLIPDRRIERHVIPGGPAGPTRNP